MENARDTLASKATIVDFDLEQRSCMRITSSHVSALEALLTSALYFTVWIHVFGDFDRISLVQSSLSENLIWTHLE